ncbi:hypothetical protein [Spiroplasma sp. SV19]|uniref:hypothetical protein n=1 Tax=Spiroplasma sp. SV19 TaxID=2570468 RepID=UPI0024B70BCD|nr:hypothetical protein [Spiroplasma sp. SV19]WHQ36846.1 PTS lactose transporter subunit IIB [Spiroplasma sp. SV19]
MRFITKRKDNFALKVDQDKSLALDDLKHAKKGIRKMVQKFGSFMAGMIMPTVSLLIAWGLMAAMFLTNVQGESIGWFNVPALGRFVGPTMKYLIPSLIGFMAGKMIYDVRGGMLGAFVTFAAIIGNDWVYDQFGATILLINGKTINASNSPNQIIGAMILAPLTVYGFKKIEKLYINRVKVGFEMLVKNFSLALIAIIYAIMIFYAWGWIMFGISWVMISIINLFTKTPWVFPFMAILTEPLRAMFLNNALNHGVMVPLGTEDVVRQLDNGVINPASWFFMVGGNPGPGFGLLLAYVVWRKQQRAAALGSSPIQLLGGIHEVHYVYIVAEPIMILATISGAFVSLGVVAIFSGGTRAVISPGSLISVIAMSPTAIKIAINIIAVLAGALTAFGVASFIMIFKRHHKTDQLIVNVTDEGIAFQDPVVSLSQDRKKTPNFNWAKAKLLMVACDAGMGSSAMAAAILRKWCEKNNIDIIVKNCAVKDLTPDVDICVTMKTFADIAHEKIPNAYIYPVSQFLGKNIFDNLHAELITHKQKRKQQKEE